MESALSDADCVARSLGEPKAFEPIFDRHFAAVHRYLHRRAGTRLSPTSWRPRRCSRLRAARDVPRDESALPWLYGIATNLLRRRWRAERRQLRAYARSGVDQWAAYEDEATVAGRRWRAPGWQELSRRCVPRSAMRCSSTRSPDLSYEEIALALDVPVGTVRTWLHRAREVARRELAAEDRRTFPLATTGADLHV